MQELPSYTLPKFRLKISCLILAITLVASPLVALGDHDSLVSLGDHDYGGDSYFNKGHFVYKVVEGMVPYWYVKNKMKERSVRSYCYFDSKVEKSISCPWIFGSNARDSRSSAKKRCKRRGGSKCVQFWANGKLKYKKTPEADAKKYAAVFENIGSQDYDTGPLIEGQIANEQSRESYQTDQEWFKKRRKSGATKPHHVACGTGESWTVFYMEGIRTTLKHVRNMCVLRCQAFQDFFGRDEGCFIYSEDGKFVSPEAERILTN